MNVTLGGQLWFFWLAVIFLIGLAPVGLALLVGYYVKVFRPKHQGR